MPWTNRYEVSSSTETSINVAPLPHSSHGTKSSAHVGRKCLINVCIHTMIKTRSPWGLASSTTTTAWVGSVMKSLLWSGVPKHLALSTCTESHQSWYLSGRRNRCEFTLWPRETSVSDTVNSGTASLLGVETIIRNSSRKVTLVSRLTNVLPSADGKLSTWGDEVSKGWLFQPQRPHQASSPPVPHKYCPSPSASLPDIPTNVYHNSGASDGQPFNRH